MKKHYGFFFALLGVLLVVFIAILMIYGQGTTRQLPPATSQAPAPVLQIPTAPGPHATDQEKAVFMKKINNLASQVNTMVISSGCTLTPPAVRIKQGSSFIFKNQDKRDHVITIIDQVTVKAGSQQTIVAQFSKGLGIYGVSCDAKGTLGFMLVERGS